MMFLPNVKHQYDYGLNAQFKVWLFIIVKQLEIHFVMFIEFIERLATHLTVKIIANCPSLSALGLVSEKKSKVSLIFMAARCHVPFLGGWFLNLDVSEIGSSQNLKSIKISTLD